MKKGKLIGGALLVMVTLFACLNTITTPKFSAVTVRVQAAGRMATLSAEPLTIVKQVERYAGRLLSTPQASAYIPSIVSNVRLTVTAADMATLRQTANAAGLDSVTISLDVPIGLARNFLVEGLDATSAVVFNGQKVVDLTGAPVDIPITMVPGSAAIPQLLSTLPADSAAGVAYRPVISATFDVDLDPATVTAATCTVAETQTGTPVAGTVGASGATATFSLAADLLPNTDYTVTISTGVRSSYGIPLTQNVVWLFTTMPTIPTVVAVSPANGETGVALNTLVTAVFSEGMAPATINATTFTLSSTAGTVTYNASDRIATFTPGGLLASGTTYTATITNGALSANNVPLAQDHVWSFITTTGTGTTTDTTAPVFAGIDSGAVLSQTSLRLFWLPATDDWTPQGSIAYLASQSTTSGIYATIPTYVTTPGATSLTVTALTPGVTYYFKVNARDEAGNVDTNTKQWWSTPSGRYVDAASGNDGNSGSEAFPFKTVTKALSTISPTNTAALGVYVAAGVYNTANGEVFPLQLTPFTTLYCQGQGNTTVFDATGSGADALYGNIGAVINGCKIIASSGRTGIDDSIGGAGGTPGTPSSITLSGSVVEGPAKDAVTLSARSSVVTSTITGTGERGIYIRTGRPAIASTVVSGKQTGIDVAADTDPSIDGNTIENNGVGIIVTALSGRPSVRNNTILNNGKGILVAAGAPLIHKNEVRRNFIAGNDVGIEIAGGMPTVSFNVVTNNNVGISVLGGTPTVRFNAIFCNTTIDLQVLANVPINARMNSWDHGPPTMDLVSVSGVDIWYTFAGTGIPVIDHYGPSPANACP